MATTDYRVYLEDGQSFWMRADMVNAAAPIYVAFEGGANDQLQPPVPNPGTKERTMNRYVVQTDAGVVALVASSFDDAVSRGGAYALGQCDSLDDFCERIEQIGDGAWGTVTCEDTTEQHGTRPDETGKYVRF